jgi:HEAT repeat protein
VGPETDGYPRAEEALRLLSAAAGAARLYPATSPLPAEAVANFTARANETAGSSGPMRIIVDPHGFRIGDTQIGSASGQIVALAEALHAMQVGQLIIAPGLAEPETEAFISIANADPASVRAYGGPRGALVAAGVSHIAVIEVSLRSSEETGLLGIDLMAAPLDEIADEVVSAAERWHQDSGAGGDEMAAAVDRLEAATRELAVERVASALMRLDEVSRMKVLAYSLKPDARSVRADGMLSVIARMKPAALARLLMLVASQASADPQRIAAALPLPDDIQRIVAQLLAPTLLIDDSATTSTADQLAEQMALPLDTEDIGRQVALASPKKSAGRALSTAVAVSQLHPEPEAARAIGDSLAQAARDGAFAEVRGALRRLDELATDRTLADASASARAALSDPAVLVDICSAVATDADAAIAGEILSAAGPAGADALLTVYVRAPAEQASLLQPVLRSMSQTVLGVARSRLRTDDRAAAVGILRTLSALGDRRAVPVISQGLDHLDESVRHAAITALADANVPDATAALAKALAHPEPATQRFAVREMGRVRAEAAIPQLTRALEDLNVLRSHELKKEIVHALQQIGTPEADNALRRTAERKLVWGRKSRELRTEAREARATIRAAAPPQRS